MSSNDANQRLHRSSQTDSMSKGNVTFVDWLINTDYQLTNLPQRSTDCKPKFYDYMFITQLTLTRAAAHRLLNILKMENKNAKKYIFIDAKSKVEVSRVTVTVWLTGEQILKNYSVPSYHPTCHRWSQTFPPPHTSLMHHLLAATFPLLTMSAMQEVLTTFPLHGGKKLNTSKCKQAHTPSHDTSFLSSQHGS